ncbi:MAG: RagB/SusD family nutrient uptake outer membrane protein [Tannerella sp.]|jgi:hypothetical protein|nr:RagB/SusD family nutrient uptake outer membrane protein [Tannerella sp.]
MKQYIKHIALVALLGGALSACQDLTLQPKGILDQSSLFGSEYGVETYFSGLYNNLPIEEFVYYADKGFRPEWNYWQSAKNSLANSTCELDNGWMRDQHTGFGYWPYDHIRDVNNFIQNFPDYKGDYDETTYNALMGEAHFLRAFYYFGLAKRYGGVPLVTTVQDPTGNPDSLKVKRATESATWHFIHDELETAMQNLPATSVVGRANKYVAAALMSRAMLYAGRIAKYSHYLGFQADQKAAQQGLVTMDPSEANYFFQASYDAGKMILQGPYSLYNLNPDKAQNYADLFLATNSPEDIFVKQYDHTAPHGDFLCHTYDAMMVPTPDFSSFVGSEGTPPYDLMKLFDFPAITDKDGKPVRFDKAADIKNGMEPRLRGIMYFTGDQLRGHTFDIQRGLYVNYQGTAAAADEGSATAAINASSNRILTGTKGATYTYEGTAYAIAGTHGCRLNDIENNSLTGAFVRKYINPNMSAADANVYMSDQAWKVFRLGEIYLNMAEAAYELGKKQEAFEEYIAPIRERAGATPHSMVANPADLSATYGYPIDENLQYIRDERYRELCFENQRWWDLRTWGVVDRVLRNFTPKVLFCYHVLDENKYIYLEEKDQFNGVWNYGKNAYYEPIPASEISKNANLVQNPLY